MRDSNAPSSSPQERPAPVVPVRVQWHASAEAEECVEVTRLLNVTPRSATFTLSYRPNLGQLLHLTLPSGRAGSAHARRSTLWGLVWALVPPAQPARASNTADAAHHTISVVFVGEDVPVSFDKSAATRYSYVAEEDGRFRLQREASESPADARSNKRRESRIPLPVEVLVEVLDEQGHVTAREQTVTENLSRRGAAVWTTLAVEPETYVMVTSERYRISMPAVVRARRTGADGIARLHLEFLDHQWPLEGLY